MSKKKALAVVAAACVVPLTVPLAASAHNADTHTYQATLSPLNGSGGSGTLTLTRHGNQATVSESVSGLAVTFKKMPYPHVQHIHGKGKGRCPTAADDQNGDGVVDTVEGRPDYGKIQTSLTTKGDTSAKSGTALKRSPTGGSFTYNRTFTLNQDTIEALEAGNGVIVVHGLNPKSVTTDINSKLVPSLPLAATAPALCGALAPVADGGVAAGGGSTSGIEQPWLFGAGAAALLAAGATVALRRRTRAQN